MVLSVKIKRTLKQILIWGVLLQAVGLGLSSNLDLPSNMLWLRGISFFIIVATTIIFNLHYLLPAYYLSGKTLQYYLLAISYFLLFVLVMNYFLSPYLFDMNKMVQLRAEMMSKSINEVSVNMEKIESRFFIFRFMFFIPPFVLGFFGSTTSGIMAFAKEKENRAIELEREQLKTEIKFLKAQINPHFLFNTLNNIYTLVLTKNGSAPNFLIALSDMLRYMVYDCKEDLVSLNKEILYLKDYISLASLKDSKGLNLEYHFPANLHGVMVPPLLFIALVENSFKYSKIENLEFGWIKMKMQLYNEQLHFEISNSYFPEVRNDQENSGVGLENLSKRLQLLYPNRHSFNIDITDDQFRAEVMIQLS